MEKQKTKLGARILSAEELEAVLPNAESVYEQIAVFRSSVPDEYSTRDCKLYEIEQRTNNIGIMGCRGAGKTSILKTFYHKLKKEAGKNEGKKNSRDIILPMIIPENMSSGTTLMDAVLGRLKSVVEERKGEEEKDRYAGDCIYSGRASLEQQYNELVKQYCYIKKDYRDILIQQFTTEQNYVDKTKKVFGSDSEFIRLFHQFVINLLYNGKKSEESPMMFLFIDDVDLSAHRCMDIVGTLLVYLSNPRIVTFISGDMGTFEEELTLEFLRQEGALSEEVFRESYYGADAASGGISLLERKKTLACEYIKKIVPPAYRRTIRYWALEERGSYRVAGNDGSPQKSLAELLVEVTREKVACGYFEYQEDGKQKYMKLAFHMLDGTSRGLNNVYTVLQELYELQAREKEMEEEEKMLLFWRLIETMVDSKPVYAEYKSELLNKVIVLGQGQVRVDFANAYRLLYGDEKEEGEEAERFSFEERFALFYLIDFSIYLFFQEQQELYDLEDGKNYLKLKNKVIQEYLSDETIDGRIASKRRQVTTCLTKESSGDKDYDSEPKRIFLPLLKEADFLLAYHLIRCLGRKEVYEILHYNMSEGAERQTIYTIAHAFLRAAKACSESEEGVKDYISFFCKEIPQTMRNLLDNLSINPCMIYGGWLSSSEEIASFGMQFMKRRKRGEFADAVFWNIEGYITEIGTSGRKQPDLLWAEYENRNAVYWIYFEKNLNEYDYVGSMFDIKSRAEETIRTGLIKAIMEQMQTQKIVSGYEVRALQEVVYDKILEGKSEKEKKAIQVIEQIDKQGLWGSSYAENKVYWYFVRKKRELVGKLSRGRAIFDATQLVKGAYAELKKCIEGSFGRTMAGKLEHKIRRVIFLSVNGEEQEPHLFADGKFYLRLEQVLVIQYLLEEFFKLSGGIQHGKREVRKLLMEMKELPLVLYTSERNVADEELRKREDVFFAQKDLLRCEATAELEVSESGKKTIREICKEWYDVKDEDNRGMKELMGKYFFESGGKEYRYLRHLVQKCQIERLKEKQKEGQDSEGQADMDWSDIEPSVVEKDDIFFLHSYFRYLQEKSRDKKKAGVRAEEIAKLAQYILDCEIIADEQIQGDFYQAVGKGVGLTEEELNALF